MVTPRLATLGHLLLFLSTAFAALPEIAIEKKSYADFGNALPARLKDKREANPAGVDTTNVFSILTWSSGGAYYANVTVGTPPQEQVVILDTGSSDLYFDASGAPACRDTSSPYSCRGGTFNSKDSKTYKVVAPAPAFNTSFGDGSTASGPFAVDSIGIGNVIVQNVQFGVAEEVDSTTGYAVGLMGIGYSANEATETVYPNMPEVLKSAGVINSRLYSIYLNDVGQSSGSILFGGIDTSKFTPPLVTLDLLASATTEQVDQFITTITATSVKVNGKSKNIFSGGSNDVSAYGTRNPGIAALLDTGSAAWSVPDSYYQAMLSSFSYVDPKTRLCACKYRDAGDTITVTFGGKLDIVVPAQEFIIPLYNATTGQAYQLDTSGNTACRFMISPGKQTRAGFYILGDAVLRSMYVVFDLDNGEVSLAQAAVNTTAAPTIVTIAAGPTGVASAFPAVSQATSSNAKVATTVKHTNTFAASTIASTIGVATGTNAVPVAAQTSPTKGAAAVVTIPQFQWGGVLSLAWMLGTVAVGAALLL